MGTGDHNASHMVNILYDKHPLLLMVAIIEN